MSQTSNTENFKVAIVGRPNVGKSSLFNALTRSRKSVVKNQPGVTRDIISEMTEWWGKTFEVLDTGGLTRLEDDFSPLIFEQVLKAIGGVHFLVVVMDAKTGLLPEDKDIVRVVKESGKPFVLVVNKVDREHEAELKKSEFYELGVDIMHASFEQRVHVDVIVEEIIKNIPENLGKAREGIRLSVIGKPNAGKSSLCNRILNENRMIVSSVAGTTVDAVEEGFEYKGEKFIIVDTAGLRRQGRRLSKGDGVEILSAYKSYYAIDKSDIVLLIVDGMQGPTEQDAKMADYAFEKNKAVIMVASKVDLSEGEIDSFRDWFRNRLDREFHFAPKIPLAFTSAVSGKGVKSLLDLIITVWRKLDFKTTTSELNDFFYDAIRQAPSPVYRTTNVKFYYITQTGQKPPSFIAFANHPDGVTPQYRRFLIHRLQERFNLEGIPVRIFVMKSGS